MSLINNHFKTFLITLLSLTLLFSISCSDAYKPSDGTRTLSYYAGDWWTIQDGEELRLFTINADGSVVIYGDPTTNIPSTDITKNSDTSYTYYENAVNSANFNFTSDTEGTFMVSGYGAPYDITKK